MSLKTAENRKLRLVSSEHLEIAPKRVIGELWDSDSAHVHSMHSVLATKFELKPQIADYCIHRYTTKAEIVFDPFCGQGTSLLQANLLGRIAWGCDLDPLAIKIASAKLSPVGLDEVVLRLNQYNFQRPVALSGFSSHLAAFYHADTYRELINLRSGIIRYPDAVSRFIELLATSRLHGHTPAYFSAYTFPNVSLSAARQQLINRRRREEPEYRALAPRIIKKAAQVLRDGFSSKFYEVAVANIVRKGDARNLRFVPNNSIDFIVTKLPDGRAEKKIINNWLENWFLGINSDKLLQELNLGEDNWKEFIAESFSEMLRVVKPGRHVVLAFSSENLQNGFSDEDMISIAESIRFQEKRFIFEELLINREKSEGKMDNNNRIHLIVLRVHALRNPKLRISSNR